MTPPSPYISATNPLTPSIDRVKEVLFRPFDLSKWLVIGFCAWLAGLGESAGGAGGGNYNYGFDNRRHAGRQFAEARDYVLDNLEWLIPLGIFVMLALVAVWLVFTWLSSRGKFMFLHCVARNRAEIRVPWNRYGHQGDSLFLFRVVLGVASFAVIAPYVIAGVMLLIGAGSTREPVVFGVALAAFILGLIGLGVVFGLISWATSHFVVPIMYLKTSGCLEGWRRFLSLLSGNKARFLLFTLFYFLVSVLIVLIVIALVLMTCCVAGCLFSIPYIGAVFLLPFSVFTRSFSLYYLAQYGRELDVFTTDEAEVLPTS